MRNQQSQKILTEYPTVSACTTARVPTGNQAMFLLHATRGLLFQHTLKEHSLGCLPQLEAV